MTPLYIKMINIAPNAKPIKNPIKAGPAHIKNCPNFPFIEYHLFFDKKKDRI